MWRHVWACACPKEGLGPCCRATIEMVPAQGAADAGLSYL